MPPQHLPLAVPGEGQLATQDLVKHHAERIHVAADIAPTLQHLGGHVVGSPAPHRQAAPRMRDELGETIVPQPRDPTLDEYVGWLDVEVHQRTLVQRVQAARRLQERPQQLALLRWRQLFAIPDPDFFHLAAQRLGASESHHEIRDPVDFPPILDRHEVGMVDLREVLDLLEFRQHRAPHIAIVHLQELDRVVLADRHPPGSEHEAEHAAAELGGDLKAVDIARLAIVAIEGLPIRSDGVARAASVTRPHAQPGLGFGLVFGARVFGRRMHAG